MSTPRQPRVFISRTTTGLKDVADEIAAILRGRGANVVIQTGFLPDWRSVPQMLQDKLIACDSVVALIGPAHGGEPDQEPARLRDERTHARTFSFTQWEYLVARDLRRPVFTFLVSGPAIVAPFEREDATLEQRQQQFIADFAKDRTALYYEYTERAKLLDHVRNMELPLNVSAGRPTNLPEPIGTLFKGRADFLESLRTSLAAGDTTVIRGKQAIHGMGGVGKTRAAIEYGWASAEKYNSLLFVTADSPASLNANLAALCGPLVLNLPEQNARETDLRIAAVLRWLQRNPGWFLVLDNVDTAEGQDAVLALIAQIPQGHILITSRLADWPGTFTSLDLDVLSEASSVELLLDHTGGRRTVRPGDAADAATIARNLDGLALALEQAAAFVRKDRRTFADYLAAWETTRARIYADYQGKGLGDYHSEIPGIPRSLLVTYDTSVAQLSENARELFRILAWIAPDPTPVWAVEKIKSLPDPRTLLVELADLHLARLTPDGATCTVHRMLQEITRQQQTDAKPQALITALEWMNGEYPFYSNDVRFWPIAVPLTPHAIAAASFGADRDITEPSGRLLNQTAVLLSTQANHRAAEPLFRRSLAINEASFGPDHPEVAIRLNNVAQLLQATNRFAEAEPLYRRSLAINEASFGPNHPEVAIGLNNLAQLLQATNRLAEAEPLMRRALAIDEGSFGKDHPGVARDLNNLALLLKATNRLAEAEPLMRRALAIDEGSLGKDHPDVARDLNNLANLLQATNHLAEAEPLVRRALAIHEASYGKDHPNVAINLNVLAHLLHATNRFAEAEPLMRRALAIDEARYGKDHPKVVIRLNNLANLLQATNHLAEAEPLMRRALAIDEASYGKDHPKVAIHLNNLAGLLQATNRIAEAEMLMRRALEIFLRYTHATGHQHSQLNNAINGCIGLLMKMGDTKAQAWEKIRGILAPYGVSI